MNLNMLLKLGKLICAHPDFAKFIYKILDICSQQKKKKKKKKEKKKIHICIRKYIYVHENQNITIVFFPFALRCTFTFPCLVICWYLWNLFEI